MSDESLTQIFDALMQAGDTPDLRLADQYIKQYPAFAADIADFVTTWSRMHAVDQSANQEVTDELQQIQGDPQGDPLIAKAMARVRMHWDSEPGSARSPADSVKVRDIEPSDYQLSNPFAHLTPQRVTALAKHLSISKVIVGKLRDCQIELTTIPPAFLRALASFLRVDAVRIERYLAGPARLRGGLEFKSRQKPRAGEKQSFESALRSTGQGEAIARWSTGSTSADGDAIGGDDPQGTEPL